MTNRKRGLHSTPIVQHKQKTHWEHITWHKDNISHEPKFISSDMNSQAPDSIELWQSTNNFARNTQKSNTRVNTRKTTVGSFIVQIFW